MYIDRRCAKRYAFMLSIVLLTWMQAAFCVPVVFGTGTYIIPMDTGTIRIDGTELLSEKTEFTAHFEISAKELLGVLRDVSDRELVEIDSMHYEFRVPVKGKRYGGDGRN